MTALCPQPIPGPSSEAGLDKCWFLNTKPDLNISNLLSALAASAEFESADPRSAAGDCRRRTTPSTALPPPSKGASKQNSQRQSKREEAPDRLGNGAGDDGRGDGDGSGGGGGGGGGRGRKGAGRSSQPAVASPHEMNRYCIPHFDIYKKVITQDIQLYLGPESSVRPNTHDGEDGFLITTPGECQTDEQIDNIYRKSKEVWERQVAKHTNTEATRRLLRPLHQAIRIDDSEALSEEAIQSWSGGRE